MTDATCVITACDDLATTDDGLCPRHQSMLEILLEGRSDADRPSSIATLDRMMRIAAR